MSAHVLLVVIVAGLSLSALCLVGGCDGPLPARWECRVVVRATSPDNRRDAVVFTLDCGARAETEHHVILGPKGVSVDNNSNGNVLRCTNGSVESVAWVNNRTLLVKYRGGDAWVASPATVSGVMIDFFQVVD